MNGILPGGKPRPNICGNTFSHRWMKRLILSKIATDIVQIISQSRCNPSMTTRLFYLLLKCSAIQQTNAEHANAANWKVDYDSLFLHEWIAADSCDYGQKCTNKPVIDTIPPATSDRHFIVVVCVCQFDNVIIWAWAWHKYTYAGNQNIALCWAL